MADLAQYGFMFKLNKNLIEAVISGFYDHKW